ncbi:MAG: MFS transporter [Ignavibacteriales bacterium]|nr:MFS transporter [Ignavibacteriales bacterium]
MRRWFEWIEGGDPVSASRNFIANVLDGALFAFGMSFVSLQTVLPVFVQNLGGSNIAVGLIPVVWTFGFNFPQMFIVSRAQRLLRKKPLFMKTSFFQRIPWLLLSFMCFFVIEWLSSSVALILFFIAFALAAVMGSVNLPVWFDLIAKLTPVKIRGRLFAMRSILGALLGIAGGVGVTFVLNTTSYPTSYGILFSLAFLLMMASYGSLAMLRETEDSAVRESIGERRFLDSAKDILRSHVNYRQFLVADSLLLSSGMGNAFFTVHALKKFSLSDAYVGVFTIVLMASTIVGSLLFGILADHFGHKLNMMISAVATLMACILALTVENVQLYFLVFVFSALTVAVGTISRLSLIAEFCGEAERPTYIALSNLMTSPFLLLGVLAGWLADIFDYEVVFIVAFGFAFSSVYWYRTKVKEPRHHEFIMTAQG